MCRGGEILDVVPLAPKNKKKRNKFRCTGGTSRFLSVVLHIRLELSCAFEVPVQVRHAWSRSNSASVFGLTLLSNGFLLLSEFFWISQVVVLQRIDVAVKLIDQGHASGNVELNNIFLRDFADMLNN